MPRALTQFLRLSLAVLAALILAAPLAQAVDAAPLQRVEKTLAAMSTVDKIGQLFMIFFTGPEVSDFCRQALAERRVGGFILYKHVGNTDSPEQAARLIAGLNGAARQARLAAGLFFGIDQEGGAVTRFTSGLTFFPGQMAIAATGRPELARQVARAMALELKSLGINVNFAPVADVNVSPDNPVIGTRSFGSDPARTALLTRLAVSGYAGTGVLCSPKHFPGHGDTTVDSHLGLPVVLHDKATLNRVDFPPFRAGIGASAPMVMTAHVETPALEPTPGLPATLSRQILTGVLRQSLGFKGLIVTDSLGMGAVVQTFGAARAARMAFEAGADVLLFGADKNFSPDAYTQAFDLIEAGLKSGEIPMARLDQSVRRILAAKEKLGLLDGQRPAACKGGSPPVDFSAHAALAQKIAAASLTLARGQASALPFAGAGTLIVWPSRALTEVETAVKDMAATHGATLEILPADPDQGAIERMASVAAKAERVVILSRDAWKTPGQAALIERLGNDKPGAVLVAATGGPYDLKCAANAAWFAAAYGDAPVSIAALGRAIFATARFPGRLPVTLAGR